jgi:hypothetical protein
MGSLKLARKLVLINGTSLSKKQIMLKLPKAHALTEGFWLRVLMLKEITLNILNLC